MRGEDQGKYGLYIAQYRMADENISRIEYRQYKLMKFQIICWCVALVFSVSVHLGISVLVSDNVNIKSDILLYLLAFFSPVGLISGGRYLALASQKYGFLIEIADLCLKLDIDDIHHRVYQPITTT